MFDSLSLHVLDIAENSVRAAASFICIEVAADLPADRLMIRIKDNGEGMTPEQLERVSDPFFTTRTTRDVGLGVPFFRQAALLTGGDFSISSEKDKGTEVTAAFILSSIDRMPLGDLAGVIYQLITMHGNVGFVFRFRIRTGKNDEDETAFTLDTHEVKELLGDVPLGAPEVGAFLRSYLSENMAEVLANAGNPAL